MKTLITISNIRIGLPIITGEGLFGVITNCVDIHNIEVTYKSGKGMHCIIPDCEEYDPLYWNLN